MGKHSSSLSIFLLLLLLQLTSILNSQSTNASLPDTEVRALGDIASKLNMKPMRYYSAQSCSDYYNSRISCNCSYNSNTVCHVTEMSLYSNQLTGSIPEELGNLTFLTYLDLSDNYLNGPIPESLGTLHSLVSLYLYNNFLNGSIPAALGELSSLKYLYMGQNQLSREIPDELGNITTLITLSLLENQLSGNLPPGLGNLTNLERLWLPSNNFTGKLPESFAKLTNLQVFTILGNNMSGQIPSFIQKWKNLTTLSLMGNNFEGPLPLEIFKLEKLDTLWVSDLRNNYEPRFHFPPLSKLTSLNSLILRNCNIGGEIPADIGDLKYLRYLDLSFNYLVGGIPNSVSNLSLKTVYLTQNKLNGSFPGGFGQSVQILNTSWDFSYNNFSDLNFTRPNNVSYMNLFAASPTATSPLQIMNEYCSNERSKYNSLNINCGGEGTIIEGKYYEEDNKTSAFYVSPNGNWAYSRSGNFLRTDTKPGDYIRNMTCGIPVSDAPLYATARISPLSLKYHGLCLHNGNYTVKLHFAEIIYTDDKDYSIMGKRIFDVYIQGNRELKDFNIIDESKGPNEVVIKNFSATVMDHTLEIHFYWAGKGSVYIPPYLYGPLISAISVIPDFELHKKELSTLVKIMIAVSSFAILLLVSASVWKIGLLRRKRLHDNVPIKIQGSSVTSITFRDIMEATQNFNPKMEIGKGGFGTVYKAELKQKGIIMAVKQLSPNSKQGTDEINNEVYSLSSLKHENLVQLLGAYSGNNQNLLLYEYMENNSLARALFDPQSSLKLSWQIRYKICLGIAKGLTYLHEESRLKIVHRDIKATNILLDKDLKAKISDFGLAKLYDRDSTHMVTRVGGTHGYMAPEYAMRGILTEKADVYSFGVVALEVISGKSNAEYKPNQESVFLLDTAFVYLKNGNILDLVDKSVRYEADYSEEQAKMMLNLAMLCTHQSLTLRPTMSEVVSILEGKKTIEEVSITQPPNVFYGAKGFRDYLSTEIPSTSTEVTSSTFSSYLSSKERDEMKNGSVELHREISDESAVTHQPS